MCVYTHVWPEHGAQECGEGAEAGGADPKWLFFISFPGVHFWGVAKGDVSGCKWTKHLIR